jgi:hypothetical protein
MRRVVFITVMCAFVATPVLADWYGGVGQWDREYYQGQGGEFTIYGYDDKPFLSNSAYADETKNINYQGSFETFCIETGEWIYEPMGMVVSTTAINESTGAVTGAGSHAVSGRMTHGDNLGFGTAYLYTQFATAQLSGYVYASNSTETVTVNGTDYDLSRSQTAGALQRVIWALEGEGGGDFSSSYYGVALNTGQQALATYWKSLADTSPWTTVGQVRVLNMYGLNFGGSINYNALKQDQLYLTPIPASVVLGLLGLGVVGLKLRKYA